MDLYKTAISALLLAPMIGGIGLYTVKQYQATKEQAEELTMMVEQQTKELEEMLKEELPEEEMLTVEMPTVEMPTENMNDVELEMDDVEGLDRSGVVENEVIRFHIRANSDSGEDQALKLEVRDAILEELGEELEQADTKEEARRIMESHLEDIEQIGARVVEEAGYDYEVDAYLTSEEFPMKSYGDLMFPAGEYEALRVDIGMNEGGNWWCVMYPGLCFVDTVGGIVATDGKEDLQRVLTPEEYEELLISPSKNTQIEYRSLLWDSLFENE